MTIYLTGDTHGDYDIHKLGSTNFPQGSELTKSDYLIILGDFGLLWKDTPSNTEKYWLKWLNAKAWTTLFLDGNHENFNRLQALESVPMFGSTVGKVTDSVFHLRRGHIYNIEGHNILTIGGGLSIDKGRRTEGISWWPQEMISHKEQEFIFEQLDDQSNPLIDYVLSHTCPQSVFDKLSVGNWKSSDPTMKILQEVLDRIVTFKHWYFGHFHIDKRINKQFTTIYQMIRRLK